jgi:hypothetical protein
MRNAFDRAVYGAERRAWIIGLLGMVNTDGTTTIHVPDRLGWVFVTTGPTGAQMVTIARNDGKVPIRAINGALVIHSIFNEGGFTDSGMSGDYTNNFGLEWHHHRTGSGLEFEFEGLLHERGRARPTTGMLAYMNAFRYYYNSVWKTWEGDTIDLTSYKPAGAGNHAWVVIGIDPTDNTATATTGPAYPVATTLTYTMANEVPFEGIPVAAVKVRNDSSSIQDIGLFIDVHEWFAGLHYSKLGDLGNVDESAGYYGLGPYFNDEAYWYGYGGYEWVTGGHRQNFGNVKVGVISGGTLNVGDFPSFGMIDVHGESDTDDDLVNITGGKIGDMVVLFCTAPGTHGDVTIKTTGNIKLNIDYVINTTSQVAVLVLTQDGWQTVSGGPAETLNLTDLGDVTITAATENDVVIYDGSEWINKEGHRLSLDDRQVVTISSGAIDITGLKTDGYFDVRGEGSVDDTLNIITGGNEGDIIHLGAVAPATYGEITVTDSNNILVPFTTYTLDSQYEGLTLVNTAYGWLPFQLDKRLNDSTVSVPKSFEIYIDKKERLAQENVHGGLDSLATAQPLDSTPTNLNVTAGVGKLLIVINAGSDVTGSITVTGTTVDRDDQSETPADTDTITVDATTTDGSGTDGNGNTTRAFTGAYITSKWFRGAVVLSTTDLTLTDVDVYQVSFEQFGDQSNITLDSIDFNALATNGSAWMDVHLYSLEVTGDKCNVTKEATLEELAAAITANKYYRQRAGSIAKALDGSTDGFWVDMFLGPLANTYWEDINLKVWYTQIIDITPGT